MNQPQRVPFCVSGVQVSPICLGTMMFGGKTDRQESLRIINQAIDLGVDFIDTAPMYQKGLTEEIVGEALYGKRDRVFLATKVHTGLTRKYIIESAENSLRRLRTDYIDLFQIHWPTIGMDLEEMMSGLNQLVKEGKTRFVGCCNFPAYVMSKCNQIANERGLAKLVSFQPPYNLIERGIEVECLPYCYMEGMAIIPYRPICMGILAGKYKKGQPLPTGSRGIQDQRIPQWVERYGDGVEKLETFAAQRATSMFAVAIAWLRAHKAITAPIIGVSTLDQLEFAVQSLDFSLSDPERAEVSSFFDTEVKEETGGEFPGLRRVLELVEK